MPRARAAAARAAARAASRAAAARPQRPAAAVAPAFERRRALIRSAGNLAPLWAGGFHDPGVSAAAKYRNARSGDAWPLALLKQKSTEDLHQLWWVLLRERNFLLSERYFAWARRFPLSGHGRLKKVRLSMARILRTVTRREIHDQCVRGREILAAQQKRDVLERQLAAARAVVAAVGARRRQPRTETSLQALADGATLERNAQLIRALETRLRPLREFTLQCVAPDWRYSRETSDLPGPMHWTPLFIRALAKKRAWKRAKY